MFDGLKNTFKEAKQTGTQSKDTIFGMIKDIPNLPWEKLPILGWAYIILGTILFLLIIFVLIPLL